MLNEQEALVALIMAIEAAMDRFSVLQHDRHDGIPDCMACERENQVRENLKSALRDARDAVGQ